MVSFRRCILALAVLALFASLASAQVGAGGGSVGGSALQCTAAVAVPPQLRAEGITELIGDIVLTCTGGTLPTVSGAVVPTANITVSLGTNVTSRILSNGGSEALLMIDEPGSGLAGPGPAATQNLCSSPSAGAGAGGCGPVYFNPAVGEPVLCTTVAAGGTCSTFSATTASNVFQGTVSGNQVTFNGIPILAPATGGFSRIFRITNVRANVAGLGGAGLAGTTQLLASIAISGSTSLPVSNPVQIAGFVQNGLSTSVRNQGNSGTSSISALGFLQCNSVPGSGSTPQAGATLRYTENFASAFKTRVAPTLSSTGLASSGFTQNIPGTIYNSESGFIFPVGSQFAGLADYGTRLRAVFSNIPAGVNVWVTTTNYQATGNNTTGTGTFGGNSGIASVTLPNASTTSIAELVQSETAPDFSNQAPIVNFTNTIGGNITLAPVTLVNGNGEAVWEVVSTNPNQSENFDFGVYFQYSANPGATGGGTPALGTGKVNMSFAPVIGGTSASSSLTIPRFVDNSGNGNNIVTISICQTDLLFPFVTNENGFETGISIANTTTDPFGTAAQNGSCVMTFYGDNAVATTTAAPCTTAGACTGVINSGKVYANTLSGILGGSAFQGYAIAVCNFQAAHGFAFISDTHATNLAMGYLALVITNGSNLTRSGAAAGENLNN